MTCSGAGGMTSSRWVKQKGLWAGLAIDPPPAGGVDEAQRDRVQQPGVSTVEAVNRDQRHHRTTAQGGVPSLVFFQLIQAARKGPLVLPAEFAPAVLPHGQYLVRHLPALLVRKHHRPVLLAGCA